MIRSRHLRSVPESLNKWSSLEWRLPDNPRRSIFCHLRGNMVCTGTGMSPGCWYRRQHWSSREFPRRIHQHRYINIRSTCNLRNKLVKVSQMCCFLSTITCHYFSGWATKGKQRQGFCEGFVAWAMVEKKQYKGHAFYLSYPCYLGGGSRISQRRAPTYYLGHFVPKTAWNWKKRMH